MLGDEGMFRLSSQHGPDLGEPQLCKLRKFHCQHRENESISNYHIPKDNDV